MEICNNFDSCGFHCPYFELSNTGNMPNGNKCNNPDFKDIQKSVDQELMVCCVCGSDACICEGAHCYECGGTGIIVTCWDDLCHTGDGCIHGDGEVTCPNCDGEGEVYPKKIPLSEYNKDV